MPSRLPRSAHQSIAPVQTVRTKDGWIYLMCMLDKFWEAMLPLIGREDLRSDPRFATGVLRGKNREALTVELDRALSQRTTDEWMALLTGVVPVGPVYDVARALANPFVETVGMVRSVPHPHLPGMKLLANPLKVNGRRPDQKACPPLGADNDEVLGRKVPAPALSK
jgi:crotonobetainyl-CoA:carnitine CoA-transferase CaiB-like acyl-CoA transferase